MTEENNTQSNPEIAPNQEIEKEVFGSDGGFFDQLEDSVNGMVAEAPSANADTTIATQNESGSEQVTHESKAGSKEVDAWDNENNPYRKRYKDSSREGIKMATQLKQLEPFMPLLDAMKKDSGLVDHVRGYLENGGAPAGDIKQQLNLKDDFEFDANELGDPSSDSSKVLNAHVDGLVQSRMGQINKTQNQQAQQQALHQSRLNEEAEFRKNHPEISDDEYQDLLNTASQRTLSLEDIHYIINKDSANNKVAMNVKKDMVEQMKNARNIPASTSGVNSAPHSANPDDSVFNALKGVDEELDNLFGDK